MLDFRAYRVMQAMGCKVEPGEAFPSLAALPQAVESGDGDDVMASQAITAMLMQASGTP